MSYCRWSSDNWKCDLYCYADCYGGYTTHVAGNRIVGEVPEAPLKLIMDGKMKEFAKAHKKQMAFLDKCKRVKIGLPYDGPSRSWWRMVSKKTEHGAVVAELYLLSDWKVRRAIYCTLPGIYRVDKGRELQPIG
jgi:hypothetical protein